LFLMAFGTIACGRDYDDIVDKVTPPRRTDPADEGRTAHGHGAALFASAFPGGRSSIARLLKRIPMKLTQLVGWAKAAEAPTFWHGMHSAVPTR
jgi:hypothetical protein